MIQRATGGIPYNMRTQQKNDFFDFTRFYS
nr:MAG TPA: hypothetical protein [Caudoviricetes sp.]